MELEYAAGTAGGTMTRDLSAFNEKDEKAVEMFIDVIQREEPESKEGEEGGDKNKDDDQRRRRKQSWKGNQAALETLKGPSNAGDNREKNNNQKMAKIRNQSVIPGRKR
ncbi:hypothetical protein ACLOJK_019429 [Asimina triloba]